MQYVENLPLLILISLMLHCCLQSRGYNSRIILLEWKHELSETNWIKLIWGTKSRQEFYQTQAWQGISFLKIQSFFLDSSLWLPMHKLLCLHRPCNIISCQIKDGAYYCYCAYVLRISRYSDFLSPMVTNTGIFLHGLKLSGESRS